MSLRASLRPALLAAVAGLAWPTGARADDDGNVRVTEFPKPGSSRLGPAAKCR